MSRVRGQVGVPRVKAQSIFALQFGQHSLGFRLKVVSDALVGAKIKRIFDDRHRYYRTKRIASNFKNETVFRQTNTKMVPRIMKDMGLKGSGAC